MKTFLFICTVESSDGSDHHVVKVAAESQEKAIERFQQHYREKNFSEGEIERLWISAVPESSVEFLG